MYLIRYHTSTSLPKILKDIAHLKSEHKILHEQFLVEHISARLNVVTCRFLGPGLSLAGGVSTSQLALSGTHCQVANTPVQALCLH